MRLLTKEICDAMPALYATEEIDAQDKVIRAKFFTPDSSWTWHAVEGSTLDEGCTGFGCEPGAHQPLSEWTPGQDVLFFGYVDGLEGEWGYFTLHELEAVRGGFGLPVERDLHFGTPRFSEVRR